MGYPQLSERQVRHLLDRCESLVGAELRGLRKKLLSRDPIPAIWELIVLDAFSQVAKVDGHEIAAPGGRTPDLAVRASDGNRTWIEVTCVQEERDTLYGYVDQLIRRVLRELKARGLRGQLEWDGSGPRTVRGMEVVWPPPHLHRSLLASDPFKEFFRAIAECPERPAGVDLRPAGYTLSIAYKPSSDGPRVVLGHGGPICSPQEVQVHPLYGALRGKYTVARSVMAGVRDPFVVVVCGHGASPLGRHRGWSEPKKQDVVWKVFRECPQISAVVVVYASSEPVVFMYKPELRVRWETFVNPMATQPLTEGMVGALRKIRFDSFELRSWSEWRGEPDPIARARGAPGGWVMRSDGQGRWVVEIPAQHVQLVLAGEMTVEELNRLAGWDGHDALHVNPFQAAAQAHSWIEEVTFVQVDPRRCDAPRVAFHFGPRRPPVLAVPKNKREGQ